MTGVPSIATSSGCYVLWAGDTRQYYVGHTSDTEARIEKHFDGMVMTTAGHPLKLLWVSGPLRLRTDARRFEAALKSCIKSRDKGEFECCTGLYFGRGATLLELDPRGRRPRR